MNANTPLVSVLLPVYQGAGFVAEAIRSICDQTLQDWELLIVDDGSQDGSEGICRSWAEKDERIKVFRNPGNLGLAKTMNRLVSLAHGEYLAIQEQDDQSAPERLAWEADVLQKNKDVAVVSGLAAWLDDEGQEFNYFPGMLTRGEQYPQEMAQMVTFLYLEQCKVVNAACMFRRSMVNIIPGPFDELAKLSIDWQFFIHIAHHYRIYGIPEVLVRMRRGSQHESFTKNKDLPFLEARRCIRLVYEDYHRDPGSPINYRLYRKAMATEMILEGRYYGSVRGGVKLAQAILYDPFRGKAWASMFELMGRGARKVFRY